MVRWMAELVASWKIDGGARMPSDRTLSPVQRVDQLLSDRSGHPLHRSPDGLARRICDGIAASGQVAPVMRGERKYGWRLAAAACVLLAVGGMMRVALNTPAVAPPESVAMLKMPVSPQPMLRLVAATFDQPLRDETARVMSDTRRATRAMTRCVPFTRWDN